MSKFSSLSIRRPVLSAVLSVVIVIFGILGYGYLGIREYPVVQPPVITVNTTYTGANASVIEMEITENLEEQINAVSGIRTLYSISEEGKSSIRVEFGLGTDLEIAANDVRDRVSRALENLPPDANPPSIRKEDPDSEPIVFLNLHSDKRDRMELTQIGRDVFRERLRTIDGISIISMRGQQRPAMRLWLDSQKMTGYDVTPLDIKNALDAENIELPTGTLEGDAVELTLRTMGRMSSVEEFNNLIIREEEGAVVKLEDIGHAELGTRDDRTILKRNGVPMVGLAAIPQPGANQIDAADELYRRVEQIKKDLPSDIEVMVSSDVTEYIRESISEVQSSIFVAFGLVVLIVYLFLRNWRATLIPIVVVPISLIGTFFIMYMAGFSINILTLLALMLSIGLVIDDAIVILENIYVKMEQGMSAVEAGIAGTQEIFGAVIASTLALLAVFTPILFLDGITGSLFKEFGVVLIGTTLISTFVALTLIPMLSTKLLKPKGEPSSFYKKTEPFFLKMNAWYRKKLENFLHHRQVVFWILGGCFLLILGLIVSLPEEIAPLEDRSTLNITATAPEGATYEYMDNVMDQISQVVLEHVPETRVLNTTTSREAMNKGDGFVTLVHPDERERSQQEIAEALGEELRKIPEARVQLQQPQTLSDGSSGMPIQFVIQSPDEDALETVLPQFMAEVEKESMFSFSDVDLKFNKPILRIDIDRERARNLGVAVEDIARTLQLSNSGSRYGYFAMDGRQFYVVGRLKDSDRNRPLDLNSIHVRNDQGQLIRMESLVTMTQDSDSPSLYRFNRISAATVSADLVEGYTIGDGIASMRKISDKVLDDRFTTELNGPARNFEESASSMNFIFLLSLVFIFLVLAAQFESLRDPAIILITVPLAVLGALASLWYFNQTMNIFSKIGIIMLIGLVAKNGILIIEFANQRRDSGLSVTEAVIDAANARFRPILMTTLSTVLGTLPLAFSFSSEGRMSMGIAVIGGLIIGTFFTLFVIPAMYTYLSKENRISEEVATGKEVA